MLSVSSRRLRWYYFSIKKYHHSPILPSVIKISNQTTSIPRSILGGYHQFSPIHYITEESRNSFGYTARIIRPPAELGTLKLFSTNKQYDSEAHILGRTIDDHGNIEFDKQFRHKKVPWYRLKKFYFVIFLVAIYQICKWIKAVYGTEIGIAVCDYTLQKIREPNCAFNLRSILGFSPAMHHRFMRNNGVDLLLHRIKNAYDREERFAATYALMILSFDTPEFQKVLEGDSNILPSMMMLTKKAASGSDKELLNIMLESVYNISGMEIFKIQFMENKGISYLCDLYSLVNTAPLIADILYRHPGILKEIGGELTSSERKIITSSLRASNKILTNPMHKIENLKQQLFLEPQNSNIISQLGSQYKRMGKEEHAVQYFKTSLEINPYQTEAAYNYAASLIKDKHDEITLAKAAKILFFGLEGLKKQKHSKDMVQKSNSTTVAETTTGETTTVGINKKQSKERSQNSNSGILVKHNESKMVKNISPIAVKAYSLIVKTCERLGELELALDQARKWSLHCNSDIYAHLNYACLLVKLEHYEEALPSLLHSIHLQPDLIKPHKTLGQCLYKLDRIEEAIEAYKEAIRLAESSCDNKNLTLLYHEYGGLLYKNHRWEEALTVFTLQSKLHGQTEFINKYKDIPSIARINPEYMRTCCLKKIGKS